MFGVLKAQDINYSKLLTLDFSTVAPSLAGPKHPQDRIEIGNVKSSFKELFSKPIAANGFNQPAEKFDKTFTTSASTQVKNGDILIAAITSCTNTSNPNILLAKKAVEKGLKVPKHIKTSLAPGSRVVTEYLRKTGFFPYLEKLGFDVAGYGCTTCIGNAGDLTPDLNEAIIDNDLICAAVLSDNRNFEARIHPNIKANSLASPPLLVAYALAGTVTKDLMTEPVGKDTQLLGVKAVIARSFERIHRSNLVGMGVLPLQFKGQDAAQSLSITGDETFDISGLDKGIKPTQDVTLSITRKDGSVQRVSLLLRIDTPIEVDYYQQGGILPFVLRQLLAD